MKKFIVTGVFCTLAMMGGSGVAHAETATTTTTSSTSEMLLKIQNLMKLIEELKVKLAAARGEVQELAKDLQEGAQGDDVKKVQELLASDPTLLGVQPTGYFGPLTKAAIMKFQERYGLEVTGTLNEATREAMKELRHEEKDGHVPPGLLRSAEVHDRIKARLEEKWGDCIWGPKFRASDCKKGHEGKGHGDDDDDNDNATSTKAEAESAIADAENAIDDLKAEIEDMEDDDADQDDIDDAKDTLEDAMDELEKAQEAFEDGDYAEAVDAAEDVMDAINGDDDDDSEDDMDDDHGRHHGDDGDDDDEDEDDDDDD